MTMEAAWPAMSIAEAHAALTGPGAPFEIGEDIIRGVPQKVWRTGPAIAPDLLATAYKHGDHTFLICEEDRISFHAFHKAVAAFASELERAGIRRGDRVAVAMRNLPEWPVAFFGAIAAGAIVTPLNAWWIGAELEYALAHSGARIAVVDAERLERIVPRLGACPALERLYVAGGATTGSATSLDEVIGPPSAWASLPYAALPSIDMAPDDDLAILYTSGTSGNPKGALITHRNMLSNIMGAACAVARVVLRREGALPAPDPSAPQQGALLAVPLFHGTGCFAWLNPAIHTGRKLVLMRKWDTAQALQLIERERLTIVGGVPTIALQLVEHPDAATRDLTSVRTVSYGGASAPPDLIRRIRQVFPNAVPSHGWGMTETSGLGTTHSAEEFERRPESCGPAIPVSLLKVMSADGARTLPAGEVGELWFKGPQVVKGYWNDSKATEETFIDGWVRTGDLARVDADGLCYIVDRVRDMVIRGGENIYCVEVENALYEHPDVLDAALVGIPHPILGEEAVAVVLMTAGATASAQALREFVAGRLSAFKVPARILIRAQPLPRNANGKILKQALRDEILDA